MLNSTIENIKKTSKYLALHLVQPKKDYISYGINTVLT